VCIARIALRLGMASPPADSSSRIRYPAIRALTGRGPNEIRSIEKARLHHAARRRGGLADRGTRVAGAPARAAHRPGCFIAVLGGGGGRMAAEVGCSRSRSGAVRRRNGFDGQRRLAVARGYRSNSSFEPSVVAAIIAGMPIATAASAKIKASIMIFPVILPASFGESDRKHQEPSG
jgi:hypothetical protein